MNEQNHLDSEEFQCSECGATVSPNDTECPKCGSEFDKDSGILNEEVKPDSIKVNLLWVSYAVFVFLIQYLGNSKHWGEIDWGVPYTLGGALGIFITTLVIFGIRKLFTKKKLSPTKKIKFFYVTSFLLFLLSYIGHGYRALR